MQRDADSQSETATRLISVPDLALLPTHVRVADRLTEMLILTDELLAEFQTEEANGMLWLEPHIERLYAEIDTLMKRFTQ